MRHTHTSHFFFFFNDTAPTEIYPLSLHDALPISLRASRIPRAPCRAASRRARPRRGAGDRLRAPAARHAPVHVRGDLALRGARPPWDRAGHHAPRLGRALHGARPPLTFQRPPRRGPRFRGEGGAGGPW